MRARNLIASLMVISLAGMASLSAHAATNKLIVKDGAGTDKFVVSDQGFIGIGNTNPTKSVDIVAPSVADAQLSTRVVADINSGGGGFITYHNRTTGLPLNGDRLGYFLFGSISSIIDVFGNPIPLNGAGMVARAEGDYTITPDGLTKNMPTAFAFETASPSSNNRTERMRINSAGNVGIGTTAPAQKLEVNGGVRLNTATGQPACDATTRGTLWFTQGGAGVADKIEVCGKHSTDTTYSWQTVVSFP